MYVNEAKFWDGSTMLVLWQAVSLQAKGANTP